MTYIFKSFSLLCFIVIAVSGKAVAPGSAPPPPPPPPSPKFPTTVAPTSVTAKVFTSATTTKVPPTTTSTTTTTTTTEAPTTVAATVIAENSDAKTSADQIPVCTCEQVKECDENAYKKVDQCKESCQSHLEYFGNSTDKYLSCFNDAAEEAAKMTKCLKSNENFCVSNTNETYYMDKPDYNVYYDTYGIKEEDDLQPNPEMQKKAREVFIQQRKFQTCVIGCMKKESVQCYESIGCGIGFPGKEDTAATLESCPLFKNTLHLNAMKTCQCLAFKQDVKKLIGKCAYVVSPYLMRKL
uniref:Uncharacterized protein n=1 Tax=Panagrolaimus davidi TaxID=227884 RepID=A0A914QP83_9BILA